MKWITLIASAALLTSLAAAQQPKHYTVTDLGPIGNQPGRSRIQCDNASA